MIAQGYVSRGKGKAAKGDSPTYSSNPRCRRRPVVAAGLLTAAALGLGAAAPTAAAEGCTAFDTVATADGVRTELFAPGQFVVEQADFQGPAAQATASSNGLSAAYAGAPHPGDTALSGIGIAGGDPSAIPTFVASQFPTVPEQERTTPAVTLRATSTQLTSSGEAIGGGDSGDGQATAGKTTSTATAGCADSGDITADAITDSEAVSFAAGTLRIGRVHSEAHAKVLPDGSTELTADLIAGQVTVAGQTVAVTEEGLVFPGGGAPLADNPLAAVLDGAGIAVSYVEAQKDPDGLGITAPGLKVRIAQETGGTAPSVVTYTFGRARARASGAPGSPVGDINFGTDGRGSESTDEFASGSSQTPLFDGGGVEAGGFHGSVGLGAAQPEVPPATDLAPEPATADPTQTAASRSGSGSPLSLADIYLALVVGATAVLGGGSLFRLIGVKLAWT